MFNFGRVEFLLIIFGWALGIMGTLGIDLIRNLIRTCKLTKIVLNDLHDLQVRIASTWWLIKKPRYKNDVLWLISMIEEYNGLALVPGFKERLIKYSSSFTEKDFQMAAKLYETQENKSIGLRKYYLHSLQKGGSEFIYLKPQLSNDITEILNNLAMYNELVEEQKHFLNQTFDKNISNENYKVVIYNLAGVEDAILDHCHRLAEIIASVRKKHSQRWHWLKRQLI